MLKNTTKLFTALAVLTLVSTPLSSAVALSVSGGGDASYSSSVSAYQEKWIPYSGSTGSSSGSAYDENISKLKDSFKTGSTSTGNQVPVGGSTSGNQVELGGNYGSSAIPGGYQYNPSVSNKVSLAGSTTGSVVNKVTVNPNYANGTVDNKVTMGGGNYGSSAIPGGYQYNPEVSNKVALAASSNGVSNKVSLGTGSTDGSVDNKVPYNPGSFGSSGSVDNKVPYNPDSFDNGQVDNKVPYNPDSFDENDPRETEDISLCQNRPYPRDIDGHWSEIYVRRLYDLCVVEGYEDGNFRPNANVTRAELVKMGLFANGIEPNNGCYDNDCGSPFNDLDAWQGKWVRPAWDNKVVEGYLYNQFRPNQAITRAEAVKVVLATYGYSPTGDNKSFFNDVHGWSVGWVERARLIGLVQGIGNGNFDPDRPITRAEAAKIVAKMIEYWDTSVARDNANR